MILRPPNPSDDAASRSATEGAAPASAAPEGCFPPPPAHHLELAKPTIRERAFDAAQRLVLSQPHMAIGQLEQNRLADFILQMAERFERWMIEPEIYAWADAPKQGCMSGWDADSVDAEVRTEISKLRSGERIVRTPGKVRQNDDIVADTLHGAQPDAAPEQAASADNSIPARTADAILGVVIQMAKDIATFQAVANQLDKRRRAL